MVEFHVLFRDDKKIASNVDAGDPHLFRHTRKAKSDAHIDDPRGAADDETGLCAPLFQALPLLQVIGRAIRRKGRTPHEDTSGHKPHAATCLAFRKGGRRFGAIGFP